MWSCLRWLAQCECLDDRFLSFGKVGGVIKCLRQKQQLGLYHGKEENKQRAQSGIWTQDIWSSLYLRSDIHSLANGIYKSVEVLTTHQHTTGACTCDPFHEDTWSLREQATSYCVIVYARACARECVCACRRVFLACLLAFVLTPLIVSFKFFIDLFYLFIL